MDFSYHKRQPHSRQPTNNNKQEKRVAKTVFEIFKRIKQVFLLPIFFVIVSSSDYILDVRAQSSSVEDVEKLIKENIYRYGKEKIDISLSGCKIKVTRVSDRCLTPTSTRSTKEDICLHDIRKFEYLERPGRSSVTFLLSKDAHHRNNAAIKNKNTPAGDQEKFKRYLLETDKFLSDICPSTSHVSTRTTKTLCNGEKHYVLDPRGPRLRFSPGSGEVMMNEIESYSNEFCK